MIRLGWRLSSAAGRSGALGTLLTASAVAFGTAILLFALSFEPALATRYDRSAWRDTTGMLDPATGDAGLMLSRTDDHWQGRHLVRMDVAALSADAPVPPGLDHVPAPGAVYLSPALASLVQHEPWDELGARFGRATGTIGEAGLRAPDELAAVVGRDAAALRSDGARIVTALDGTGRIPMPSNPIIQVLIIVAVVGALAPVGVFVATATRLSAARREQRLAALRLVGATPGQIAVFAAIEALIATLPGALGGVGLFLLLRPLVARVPLGQGGWFPDAISPPIPAALALLALVQVVGVGAAVLALRRVAISPLGARQREGRRPLRRLRLLPLAVSFVVFATTLGAISAARTGIAGLPLWALIGSFLGIILGIAIAGPWVTMLVGATLTRLSRGPVSLLAGRRLTDDPRAAFGAIGGLVMAVFVGSTYLSIASFASASGIGLDGLAVRPDVLLATVPGERSTVADDGLAAVRAAGAADAVELREVAVDAGGLVEEGVVVDCPSLIRVLAAPSLACGAGLVHLGPGGRSFDHATVRATQYLGGLWSGTEPLADVPLDVPASSIDRYAPADLAPRSRLALPAVIIEPRAFAAGGAALAPTRLAVLTDGSARSIERVRTALESAMPTSVVATVGETATDAGSIVSELGRVVSLGVVVAMLLAGASLAIAVVGGLAERRRPFALLRLTGVPVGRLRAVLMVEAAAPLVSVSVLSAVLGTVAAQIMLQVLLNGGAPAPDPGLVGFLAAATAVALLVVAAAMPLVGRITATESTRFE